MTPTKIIKLDAGIDGIPGTATYGTADRLILIRRMFDGIYTWRVLRAREGGGYDQTSRHSTLAEAKAAVQA